VVAEENPEPASGFPPGDQPCGYLADTELLSVTVVQPDHAVVVAYVVGEVDMVTGPLLQSHLDNALATRPARLIIDLSRVSFLASTGLAVLINTHTAATGQGTNLQLRNVSKAAARPLHITNLTNLFEIPPVEEGPS
jgi:anti-anti-sigma factor